jgi:hypothetical protein
LEPIQIDDRVRPLSINVLKEHKNAKIFQTLLAIADSNAVSIFFLLKFIKIQVAWIEMLSFFFLEQSIVSLIIFKLQAFFTFYIFFM